MFDLTQIFLLDNIPNKIKNEIVTTFPKPLRFKKNDIIYSQENFSKALAFVIEGTAFAISNNQNQVFLRTFNEGMCFGAGALFSDENIYISSIIAKTDTKVLFINEDILTELFNKYPETSINYIKFLSEKIRFLNKKLSIVSCSEADDTLYKYLLGITNEKGIAILPISMTLLAKTLGLSRATLYRAFDNLTRSGKIIKKNNEIKVIKNEKIS